MKVLESITDDVSLAMAQCNVKIRGHSTAASILDNWGCNINIATSSTKIMRGVKLAASLSNQHAGYGVLLRKSDAEPDFLYFGKYTQ